jgi:hypothetical protein
MTHDRRRRSNIYPRCDIASIPYPVYWHYNLITQICISANWETQRVLARQVKLKKVKHQKRKKENKKSRWLFKIEKCSFKKMYNLILFYCYNFMGQ